MLGTMLRRDRFEHRRRRCGVPVLCGAVAAPRWHTAHSRVVGAGYVLGAEGIDWLHLGVDQEACSYSQRQRWPWCSSPTRHASTCTPCDASTAFPTRLLPVGLPLTIVAGSIVGAVAL
jgi:hypothetical protein